MEGRDLGLGDARMNFCRITQMDIMSGHRAGVTLGQFSRPQDNLLKF